MKTIPQHLVETIKKNKAILSELFTQVKDMKKNLSYVCLQRNFHTVFILPPKIQIKTVLLLSTMHSKSDKLVAQFFSK